MTCPFASGRGGERTLAHLPEMTMETFISTPEAHRERIKLVIFDYFVFDVSSDMSFSLPPLCEVLYADCTDVVMEIAFKTNHHHQQQQQQSVETQLTFKELDKFTQVHMKSDMLRLFSEKYIPIAKITR
jgi:hypothetical protein